MIGTLYNFINKFLISFITPLMKILVTVGTTEFYQLVEELIKPDIVNVLKKHDVTLQYGKIKPTQFPKEYQYFEYSDKFLEIIQDNDLVISTASAGTRLDIIQCKKPHIMVCNDSLSDNHQMEMVEANSENMSCRVFKSPKDLMTYLKTANLDEEIQQMTKHMVTQTDNKQHFKKLIDEILKQPHKSQLKYFLLVASIINVILIVLLK